MSPILITKASGQTEIFDGNKLEQSLIKSGAKPSVANSIRLHIEGELKDGISTRKIYDHAFFLLRKNSHHPVAIRYSLRKAIMDLGPSGFPFEKYIAEILREKGYEVETNKILLGACVEHEVDVIACNENKLIMVEAKFHNDFGLKTDLKVALYTKARFDDLKNTKINFRGKDRFLDEGWLVTNTKFTSSAIKYGECQNIKMIGWNYPAQGNFQQMIEDSDLHPLTCLTSISNIEKRNLLNQGIVLCKTILNKPNLLHEIGLKDDRIEEVAGEIGML